MYHQGVKKAIVPRPIKRNNTQLTESDPVLKQIFLSRGICNDSELDRSLSGLPSPWLLSQMEQMVDQLQQIFEQQQTICIVADFDADGATSCAVAIRGFKLLGAKSVCFVVPNRFEYGYGLTPEIVDLVKLQSANVILTVDNGISSFEGVNAAKKAGMKVLITDHHLPAETLPLADAIVNPNLADDSFPSKSIAGVGVIFYVLMALRIRLRDIGWFSEQSLNEPNLAQLLDFVALGTVADVVSLDHVNRILVYQGIQRIRAGLSHCGIQAIAAQAKKSTQNLHSSDLAFALGPRLNAAGRMDDMSLGIQCLLTDDQQQANEIAQQLEALNAERKQVEQQMKTEAMSYLSQMKQLNEQQLPAGLCLYEEHWHQGVIGILAARIKDRIHRPVIAFAAQDDGEMKGSARSIAGVHIRDVLSEIACLHPEILKKFGGHAMAAGLSIATHDYPVFALAFDEVVAKHLNQADLDLKIYSDGQLSDSYLTLSFTEHLQTIATWGQSFPEPLFDGVFDVHECKIVAEKHLKLLLKIADSENYFQAIAFFVDKPEQWLGVRRLKSAYQLDINEYRGNRSLQLKLEYIEKLV